MEELPVPDLACPGSCLLRRASLSQAASTETLPAFGFGIIVWCLGRGFSGLLPLGAGGWWLGF